MRDKIMAKTKVKKEEIAEIKTKERVDKEENKIAPVVEQPVQLVQTAPVVQQAKPKYFMWTVVAIVIVVAIVFFMMQSSDKIIDEEITAAKVNGQVITMSELDKMYSTVPEQYKAFVSKETLLNQLIEKEVILQEAKKEGFISTEEEAKKQVDSIKKAQGISDTQFIELLKQNNMTEAELVKQYLDQITIQKFVNATILSKLVISDTQVKEYYTQNKEKFKKEEQVTVKHILMGDSTLSAEEKEAKAKSLLSEITKDSFCEYVEKYSTDTASVPTCGEYIFGKSDSFVEEFKNFSFSNKIGTIGTVNTQYGTHIIYIVKKTLAKTLTLKEATAEIITALKTEGAQKQYTDLALSLKEKGNIEILYVETASSQDAQDASQQMITLDSLNNGEAA